jgi:hypothetical protein
MFKKQNIQLALIISIPIIFTAFIAASIYLPGIFIKPKTNFLYTDSSDYYSPYRVTNNSVVYVPLESTSYYYDKMPDAHLYIHDVATNQSREISLEEASGLTLNTSLTSPDGFEVTHGSSGFLFSSGNYKNLYLVGHNTGKKLNTVKTDDYNYDFKFLGWII